MKLTSQEAHLDVGLRAEQKSDVLSDFAQLQKDLCSKKRDQSLAKRHCLIFTRNKAGPSRCFISSN